MDEVIFDILPNGRFSNLFYTQSKPVADLLKRDFKQGATYWRGNKIVGWHFIVEKRLERILIPRIVKLLEKELSNFNDLAG